MKASAIDMQTAAKKLGIGPVVLFKKLRAAGVLHSKEGIKNLPHHTFVERGYFNTVRTSFKTGDVNHPCLKTVVTPLGLSFIQETIIDAVETDGQVLHSQRQRLSSEQGLRKRRA